MCIDLKNVLDVRYDRQFVHVNITVSQNYVSESLKCGFGSRKKLQTLCGYLNVKISRTLRASLYVCRFVTLV